MFRFQLTEAEFENWKSQILMFDNHNLKSQNVISSVHGGRRTLPYAFTEQGVAMLSAVLRSDMAVKVSIQIISAFVEMRKLIANHSGLLQRMDGIERKQLETDQKFEKVLKALESKNAIPNQGVFFDGQIFDAYELASKIIRSAKTSIVLIDNYIDESTLTHLSKKNKSGNGAIINQNHVKSINFRCKKSQWTIW